MTKALWPCLVKKFVEDEAKQQELLSNLKSHLEEYIEHQDKLPASKPIPEDLKEFCNAETGEVPQSRWNFWAYLCLALIFVGICNSFTIWVN
mmetsp:Transcript_27326/g.38654  ORF Transcript_27326/g.38654 Transcript_27326/m.38654 type:complete len:92 (-) Transcript_27326:389-664(-)